jgi:hypothetical protein
MPETIGSGSAFLDYDNDGWLDVLLLNGKRLGGRKQKAEGRRQFSSLILYRNNRDGTFADITQGSGLDVETYAMGCCVGDYDNDGYDDIYVTTFGEPNRLFHNEQGTGKFRDVTQQAGVGDKRWGTSCAWVDFDNDGWLDLFVCNYVKYDIAHDIFCGERPHKSYCSPMGYDAESNALYRNNGNGTFTDVSKATGIAAHEGKALGVALCDYDHDGWTDILVANDTTPNFLFHNLPSPRRSSLVTRHFEEVGMSVGVAVGESGVSKSGMGIDCADVRNNGRLAVLISNFSHQMLTFFEEDATQLFSDRTASVGMGESSSPYLGFGLFFFDYDNDGFKDALIVNGHIKDDVERYYSNVTYGERNLLYRNRGNGTFIEVGRESGEPFRTERVSRGAAFGDYDNDGDLDVLIANNNQPAELLRNEGGNKGNWLQVEVRGSKGKQGEARGTNRNGCGVKVQVATGKTAQTDWVRSGSSYCSQSMTRLHFGLGKAQRVDWMDVTWMDGKKQRLTDVPANGRVVIEEGNSELKRLPPER